MVAGDVVRLAIGLVQISGRLEVRYVGPRALFETLGVEPWGRLASGSLELVAIVLILVPRSAAIGAVLAMGLMAGAIVSHFALLGIEFQGDGGSLFAMAVAAFFAAVLVAWVRRASLPIVGPSLAPVAG